MKIKRIVVKELFGIFDHEIPLNTDEHITIIHSPNGYGKTILLTLIDAIFDLNYEKIRPIPFKELIMDFSDNSTLRLKKKDGVVLYFDLSTPQSKHKFQALKDAPHISLDLIEQENPFLKRVEAGSWLNQSTDEVLSLAEVKKRYYAGLDGPVKSQRGKTEHKGKQENERSSDWLENLVISINTCFIETQRLSRRVFDSDAASFFKSQTQPSMVPTVKKYSEELVEGIKSKLAEYGSLSQSLDRTFPTRLVNGKHSKESAVEELKTGLKELEIKRSNLIAAGILDKEKEIDFKGLQKIDESNLNVLSVYLEDTKKKLSVFDELYARLDFLLQIINSRFLHKKLSINKKDGFIFTTSEGKELPPTSLSSGEQHELVLLYEMLFKVNPNSLILIDEPELSLHVAWQQQFLEDLEKITKLVGFDVLIATHSPQIINDRWDLTVELEGPKQ